MNKYFAKFLPTTGEIKEGDKVLVDLEHDPIHIEEVEKIEGNLLHVKGFGTVRNFRVENSTYGVNKVKLFLCSKDIKSEDYLIEGLVHLHHSGNPDYPFKVVGEISPDATWVIENQEFEEDEIELWTDFGHWRKIERSNPDYFLHAKEKGSYFKIKGQCGHFH